MGLALDALRATGAKLRKNFVDVFIEVMFLFVSVRKVNFTQMEKYGRHCEQTYRNNFTRDVDWVAYNSDLTRKVFADPSDLLANAIDQSHITKSGKCTWGATSKKSKTIASSLVFPTKNTKFATNIFLLIFILL